MDWLQQSKNCFHLRLGNHLLVSLFPLWVFKLRLPRSKFIFVPVLVCFSVAMMKTTTKSSMGRKRFILPHRLPPIIQGSQGRDLRYERTWGQELKQIMDKHGLLACFPCFAQLSFLHKTGPPTWSPPHQSLMKKMSFRHAYQPVLWRQFHSWGPSSQVTIACVKLTNTDQCCSLHHCVSRTETLSSMTKVGGMDIPNYYTISFDS